MLGGDVQETSKKNVLKAISDQDMIQEVISFSYLHFNLPSIFNSLSLLYYSNWCLKLVEFLRKRHHKASSKITVSVKVMSIRYSLSIMCRTQNSKNSFLNIIPH